MRPTYPSTEDLSEISETGTGRTGSTSGRSAYSENRDELYAILGLTENDELFTDRFRIDRKKLEDMILDDNETLEATQSYFQRIMERTGTHIAWPSRLKIGAKSKKDPYVRVAGGNTADVQSAKEEILSALGIKNNQVTMKLNVSYTHHSHIIGEGGQTITRVRNLTGCHIHFPDSNRTSTDSKSNQVSITGPIDGVEKARSRVRELIPLVFCFEPPLTNSIETVSDSMTPYMQKVSEKYNVHVQQKTRSRFHPTLVIVKGRELDVNLVKEATALLINHICGKLASQVPVQMTMEISPQHHPIVKGPQSQYLRSIMERTRTQIMFPDATDPNIPILKRSNVTISGQIDDVYLARQQLMGSLPVFLSFSLQDEVNSMDPTFIEKLEEALDVEICTRHCQKQSTFTVIIKGIERNVYQVYEARRRLLNSDYVVQVEIPDSYHIPNPTNRVFAKNETNNIVSTSPLPNYISINTAASLQPISPQEPPNILVSHLYSPMWSTTQFPPGFGPVQWNQLIPPQQLMIPRARPATATITSRDSSVNSSGYNSRISYGSSSPVSENTGFSNLSPLNSSSSTLSTSGASPRNLSPTMPTNSNYSMELNKLLKVSSEWQDRRPPGFDYPQQNLVSADYDQMKLLSLKAIENQPKSSELRVPTSVWSGYGLSFTSPSSILSEAKNQEKDIYDADLWQGMKDADYLNNASGTSDVKNSYLTTSNTLESTSKRTYDQLQDNTKDLSALLVSIGMERYVSIFKSQEIDLPTFLTLDDKNLKEIGIRTYGARFKMRSAINQIKAQQSSFVNAAPGAERKKIGGWSQLE